MTLYFATLLTWLPSQPQWVSPRLVHFDPVMSLLQEESKIHFVQKQTISYQNQNGFK